MSSEASFDGVVVGGGFYGCAIAAYLAQRRGFRRVLLLEREGRLLRRASYHNQARVHNGYHYPRSFTTAYRSRVNLSRFVEDWPDAVEKGFVNLYAVARGSSKVTSRQFERFCSEIGARLEPLAKSYRRLFDERLVEDVFVTEEYAFDASKLGVWATETLAKGGVEVHCDTNVTRITRDDDGALRVEATEASGPLLARTRHLFNCTYSGINQIAGDAPRTSVELKQEIAELALVEAPPPLDDFGVTLVDGPFFSMMPFPSRGLHTLTHVRYTPHLFWMDQPGLSPYAKLDDYERTSRVERMLRDAARYMPAIRQARHVDSLFEVKTVLVKNERDDGRPILFERCAALPGYYAVLGAKIDNIYDVLEKLDSEPLEVTQ